MSDVWAGVAAIASVIQAIVVIFAARYGLSQLKEATRNRALSAVLPLFLEFDSAKGASLRYRLFNELPVDLTNELSTDSQLVLDEVVRQFDFLGFLVESQLVDFRLVAPLYFRRVLRAWQRVNAYVNLQRQTRPSYAARFEELYSQCEKYRLKCHPNEDVYVFRRYS